MSRFAFPVFAFEMQFSLDSLRFFPQAVRQVGQLGSLQLLDGAVQAFESMSRFLGFRVRTAVTFHPVPTPAPTMFPPLCKPGQVPLGFGNLPLDLFASFDVIRLLQISCPGPEAFQVLV